MDQAITHDIASQQRRAFDFMLDALGLPYAKDKAYRATRLLEMEHHAPALLSEVRGLRLRVAQLENELKPNEAELDALERTIDSRIAGERERRLDDI